MLVPLLEILSESIRVWCWFSKVVNLYNYLTQKFKGEYRVLLRTAIDEIASTAGVRVAEAVKKVRSGDIVIKPGYDGVFGEVKIWPSSESVETNTLNQTSLF
jgi:PHP family Zn ribbon phosphoesterase